MATGLCAFQNDLEYMDDNAEKLGRQKMRSDAMKRQFAINGQNSPFFLAIFSLKTTNKITSARKKCWLLATSVLGMMILHRRHPLLQWVPECTYHVH